jgi:hypothetical protein
MIAMSVATWFFSVFFFLTLAHLYPMVRLRSRRGAATFFHVRTEFGTWLGLNMDRAKAVADAPREEKR